MSLLADLTIETENPNGTWTLALSLPGVTIAAPATLRNLGRQALEAAIMYRDALKPAGAVRARLEHGLRSATSYAGPLDLGHLPAEEYRLLLNLYARGVIILADGDRVAESLVSRGLVNRELRVHGAVRGRQYVPAGPHTLQWHVYAVSETVADGWLPISSGTVAVPADTQETLDLVVAAIARYRAGVVGRRVRVVGTVLGTTLTAFEDVDPDREFEVGRTVLGKPIFVTLR